MLTVDGQEIETKHATVAPNASASVTFAQFTVAEANIRGTVRAGTDPLPADNTFHFVVSPERAGVGGHHRRATAPMRACISPRRSPSARRPRSRPKSMPVVRVPPVRLRQARRRRAQRHGRAAALGGRRARSVRRARRRPAGRRRRAHVVAASMRRLCCRAGSARAVDRLSGRTRDARLPRLQPSGVRDLQGAAQRRLLVGAHVPLSHARHARSDEPRARAVRRWRRGGRGKAHRRRPRHRLDHDAGRSWTDLPVKPVYLPLVHQLDAATSRATSRRRRG